MSRPSLLVLAPLLAVTIAAAAVAVVLAKPVTSATYVVVLVAVVSAACAIDARFTHEGARGRASELAAFSDAEAVDGAHVRLVDGQLASAREPLPKRGPVLVRVVPARESPYRAASALVVAEVLEGTRSQHENSVTEAAVRGGAAGAIAATFAAAALVAAVAV